MAKRSVRVDLVFTALADPTRRGMIEQLSRGPASVSQLAAPYGIALPTAVRHLGQLQNAGIITTRKRGRVRMCTLTSDAFDETAVWIEDRRRVWTTRLDALDTALDTALTTALTTQGEQHELDAPDPHD